MTQRPLILITNDDGIDSPGLHAVATAVADLGDLLIIAPSTQQTGAGRSHIRIIDKAIYAVEITLPHLPFTPIPPMKTHVAYKAAVSPAQAVALGMFDLATRPIDLCISGINYGENVGAGITASGTVGAAMEASLLGMPAIAMSLQTRPELHLTHNAEIDFAAAAYFTRYFAQKVLAKGLQPGVDLLKIDVPETATPETPWRIGRISRQSYYVPTASERTHLAEQKQLGYKIEINHDLIEPDSDIYILTYHKEVVVVPVTTDLTASVNFDQVAEWHQ